LHRDVQKKKNENGSGDRDEGWKATQISCNEMCKVSAAVCEPTWKLYSVVQACPGISGPVI